jgi:hypothetical protein
MRTLHGLAVLILCGSWTGPVVAAAVTDWNEIAQPAIAAGRPGPIGAMDSASISVVPADPDLKMPDGTTGYPETVLLRLITSEGRRNVTLATTEDGAGLGLGGESNPTYVQVLARGGTTSLKLTDRNGREQLIKP